MSLLVRTHCDCGAHHIEQCSIISPSYEKKLLQVKQIITLRVHELPACIHHRWCLHQALVLNAVLRHDIQHSHAQNAPVLSILWMLMHLEKQCLLRSFWQNHVCWSQSSACCFAEAGLALPCQHEARGKGRQGAAGPASPDLTILKTTPACMCSPVLLP